MSEEERAVRLQKTTVLECVDRPRFASAHLARLAIESNRRPIQKGEGSIAREVNERHMIQARERQPAGLARRRDQFERARDPPEHPRVGIVRAMTRSELRNDLRSTVMVEVNGLQARMKSAHARKIGCRNDLTGAIEDTDRTARAIRIHGDG